MDEIDNIKLFLENDILGKMVNLHTTLSDIFGRKGPANPLLKELSRLCADQVDFVKHG